MCGLQVRSQLTDDARRKVNTIIITDVHARDIIDTFVRDSVMDAREFAWESQLRFYWDKALVSSSFVWHNPNGSQLNHAQCRPQRRSGAARRPSIAAAPNSRQL